jgi:ATP-binding cassette subfamily G (WHITE) protein 2 (SNQ2)
MQVSTNAKVTLWDNSTQGLDATTSVRFGKSLQTYVKSGRNVAIAALYQASDDLAHLFDKITILHEGRQIFFGTIPESLEYLSMLGFVWPDRQSLTEYLVSVTEPDLRSTKEGWFDRVPRSSEDWVKCWKESSYYSNLQQELLSCLKDEENDTPSSKEPRKGAYVLSWRLQL